MKMEVVKNDEYMDYPNCGYCDSKIEDPDVVEIGDADSIDCIYLHRNCVIAFGTRIINEFERL